MRYIDEWEFDSETSGDELTLVLFFGHWCNPCKVAERMLDEIGGIKMVKMHLDHSINVAKKLDFHRLPAMFLFKNSELISRKAGIYSQEELAEWINNNK